MRLVIFRLLVVIAVGVLMCAGARAVEVIHQWPIEPGRPVTALVAGADGAFYGFTRGLNGESYALGEAIRVTASGEISVINTFNFSAGGDPSGLFVGADGNIYGTTTDGGETGWGVFFRLTPSGEAKTIWNASARSKELESGLVQGDDGNFYGVSPKGGASKRGAIFRISQAGRYSIIATLSDLKAHGAYPRGTLLKGSEGALFGACEKGGAGGGGVVFEVTTAGGLVALHSFDLKTHYAPKLLLRGIDGALYGNVSSRASRKKQVFRLAPTGVIMFWDIQGIENLTEAPDGSVYATVRDAHGEHGSIFRLTAAGEAAQIFAFDGTNGSGPLGLTVLPDGTFLGATRTGGAADAGTLFRLNFAGKHTLLHTFHSERGFHSVSALVRGVDNNFYGVMPQGGLHGKGTVFRLTPGGEVTVLHAFTGVDGAHPRTALLAASDGALYGTTEEGGADNSGTLFKITPEGQFTSLFSFSWEFAGGGGPVQGLIEGDGGLLYGATSKGGKNGAGAIYSVAANGVVRAVSSYPFGWYAGGDGCLVSGPDGALYGLGSAGFGSTVFYRVVPDGGVMKVLHRLTYGEGASPSGLTLGSDGNFYGTCMGGGAQFGAGTIFRITPSGRLTVLRRFSWFFSEVGNSPSRLVSGSDGNLYGTTAMGGINGAGIVFKLTTAGELSVVDALKSKFLDGDYLRSALAEGADGQLYGLISSGFAYRTVKELPPNRLPDAWDDQFLVGAKSARLDVLQNDYDVDGDPLRIAAVTQGSFGSVEVSNDGRSLVYHPGAAFTGVDRFSYEVSDGRGGTVTKCVLVRSWSQMRATYSLPLQRANGEIVGRLDLRLGGDGMFTGKAHLLGRVIPVRGRFDSYGLASVGFPLQNDYISLGILTRGLDAENFTPRLEGFFSVSYNPSSSFSFSGGIVAASGDFAGRYTLLLDVPEAVSVGPKLPRGRGWGAMSVKADGSVIAKGQLPDGKPFSAGGWFTDQDGWIFCAASGRRFLVSGNVTFADIPEETDAAGNLSWISQATWRGPFPLGFETAELKLSASRYVPPANGGAALDFNTTPAKAAVVLRDGDLTEDVPLEATFVSPGTAVESGGVASKFRIDRFGGTEGILSGTFSHPTRLKQKVAFRGIVFQKQNRAEALFADRTQTGTLILSPK